MTNIPAAWYPDPSGSAQKRWWDGTQWTEHFAPGEAPKPAPTSSNTPFIWVVVLLPLLSIIGLMTWDLDAYIAASAHPDPTNPFAAFDGGYLLVLGLSWVVYGVTVLFAWLDVRALRARGVDRPFHWAWTFLGGPLVYIIGRTVVLRRRKLPAFAPLWAFIAVDLIVFAITMTRVIGAIINAYNTGVYSSLYSDLY